MYKNIFCLTSDDIDHGDCNFSIRRSTAVWTTIILPNLKEKKYFRSDRLRNRFFQDVSEQKDWMKTILGWETVSIFNYIRTSSSIHPEVRSDTRTCKFGSHVGTNSPPQFRCSPKISVPHSDFRFFKINFLVSYILLNFKEWIKISTGIVIYVHWKWNKIQKRKCFLKAASHKKIRKLLVI